MVKLMRRTAECNLLQQLRNDDILEELDMDQSQKKLEQYKQNWLDHVRRLKDIRHPQQLLDSRADGRQILGRPLKKDAIARPKFPDVYQALVPYCRLLCRVYQEYKKLV
jgi:hypothetical protein